MTSLNSRENEFNNIRIIVADDCPLTRLGIRACLDQAEDIRIVAETGDSEELLTLLTKLLPDIVIMNIDIPGIDSLEATGQISEKYPEIKVLILIPHLEDKLKQKITNSKAAGYFVRNLPADLIVHSIRQIASGKNLLVRSNQMNFAMVQYDRDKSIELTEKELQFLKYIAQGKSNKQIAQNMGYSLQYVKFKLSNIFSKIGVLSRTEAISVCFKSGILTPDDFVE